MASFFIWSCLISESNVVSGISGLALNGPPPRDYQAALVLNDYQRVGVPG